MGAPKTFFLFIDLRKAYDLVPCEALWEVLAKLGVPDPTIQLIKAFHQDMQATIQLDGQTLEPIDVDNGRDRGAAWHRCFSTFMHVSLWSAG